MPRRGPIGLLNSIGNAWVTSNPAKGAAFKWNGYLSLPGTMPAPHGTHASIHCRYSSEPPATWTRTISGVW